MTGVPQFDAFGDYLRPENPPVPVPNNILAQWCNQFDDTLGIPFLFVDVLDDMGLTNNNFHINVADNFASSTFTLRVTNTGEGNPLGAPWLDMLPPEVDPNFNCPPVELQPVVEVDVAIKRFHVAKVVHVKQKSKIAVVLKNLGPGVANGTVTVVGTDKKGKTVANLSADFADLAAHHRERVSLHWTAPKKPTVIHWLATVTAADDSNASNDTATAKTRVIAKRKKEDKDDDHEKDHHKARDKHQDRDQKKEQDKK